MATLISHQVSSPWCVELLLEIFEEGKQHDKVSVYHMGYFLVWLLRDGFGSSKPPAGDLITEFIDVNIQECNLHGASVKVWTPFSEAELLVLRIYLIYMDKGKDVGTRV